MRKGLAVTIFIGAVSMLGAPLSCADSSPQSIAVTGKLELRLLGKSSSGTAYRLRDGVFEVTGTTTAFLSTEDQPDADTLQLDLPEGSYQALLHPGWYLERETADGTLASIEAVLISVNPTPFSIEDQRTTSVTFRFKAGDDILELGNGQLAIDIEVDDTAGGAGGSSGAGGSGDGGGSSGAGGSTQGASCAVNSDCIDPEVCVGTQPVKVCVAQNDYCDEVSRCTGNSAGCVDHRCLPPLGIGQPCSTDAMCEAEAYCSAGICAPRTLSWGDECAVAWDPACMPGLVCQIDHSSFSYRCLGRVFRCEQIGCDPGYFRSSVEAGEGILQ